MQPRYSANKPDITDGGRVIPFADGPDRLTQLEACGSLRFAPTTRKHQDGIRHGTGRTRTERAQGENDTSDRGRLDQTIRSKRIAGKPESTPASRHGQTERLYGVGHIVESVQDKLTELIYRNKIGTLIGILMIVAIIAWIVAAYAGMHANHTTTLNMT